MLLYLTKEKISESLVGSEISCYLCRKNQWSDIHDNTKDTLLDMLHPLHIHLRRLWRAALLTGTAKTDDQRKTPTDGVASRQPTA